jgi:hypothetical protein
LRRDFVEGDMVKLVLLAGLLVLIAILPQCQEGCLALWLIEVRA